MCIRAGLRWAVWCDALVGVNASLCTVGLQSVALQYLRLGNISAHNSLPRATCEDVIVRMLLWCGSNVVAGVQQCYNLLVFLPR